MPIDHKKKIDDYLDRLRDAKWFSTFDFCSGYCKEVIVDICITENLSKIFLE